MGDSRGRGRDRLPVIDGDRLVGMLSQADLARSGQDGMVGDTVQAVSQ